MNVKYYNGLFGGVEKNNPMEIVDVKNAMIVVTNEGYPFRGTAEDMAKDALSHILKDVSSNVESFPLIYERFSGTDRQGEYTTKVVFQVKI